MKPEQLGPYRIGRRLGRGGMGTVYEGVNLETDEPAAVKVLAADLGQDPGFRNRFEAEIETLRKLNHPHIVRLFGFGEQEGQLFYAMELVDGTSLDEILRHGQCFDARQTIRIGIETARALRHAHDRGIIHRDIKPANLLMAGDGQIKLSDFGIARLFGMSKLTNPGNVIGTVDYMAPEQADGRAVDPRSDLYSLGGVLYALLAGRPPFRATSLPEMLRKQREEEPEPLRHLVPEVPRPLEAVIARLLEKAPSRRVPNASLLARQLEALQRAQTREPVDEAEEDHLGFELGTPRSARDSSATENLPVTRGMDEDSGAARAEPPESDVMPETRETSAFEHLSSEAADDEEEERLQPSSTHFTAVAEEELDRDEPAHEENRVWISLQTAILALTLLAFGGLAWYALQPLSADTLYERITKKTADSSLDSLMNAEDEIRDFLVRHAADPRAQTLRKYEREIALHRLERSFERRARGLAASKPLLPIERDYLDALRILRLDPKKGTLRLQAILDLYGHGADPSGPTGRCLELARRRLDQLREEFDEHAEEHLALIQEQLEKAERLYDADPAAAREMWKATLVLYDDKPWAAAAVARAKKALAADRKKADLVKP